MKEIPLVLLKLFLKMEIENKVPKITITQITKNDEDTTKLNSFINTNAKVLSKILIGQNCPLKEKRLIISLGTFQK